jgi:hypothetical protein
MQKVLEAEKMVDFLLSVTNFSKEYTPRKG